MTDTTSPSLPARRSSWFKLAVALVASIVMLLAAEGISRFGFPLDDAAEVRLESFRDYAVDRRHRIYTPHPYTGYTPRNWHQRFRKDFTLEKQPGVFRIACLGGSTTEGAKAWPSILESILAGRSSQKVEVMNFGVSGWTTTESMLNYFLNVQDWKPDLVLVHHAANDVLPRMYTGYRSDYAHFRHPWVELNLPGWKRWLIGASHLYARNQMEGVRTNIQSRVGFQITDRSIVMSGELPEESNGAYQRNLRTLVDYASLQGATTALLTMPYNPSLEFQTNSIFAINHKGTLEHNDLARAIAGESDCYLIDLAQSFEKTKNKAAQFFRDGVHLEQGGHQLKAKFVADALIEAGIVAGQ